MKYERKLITFPLHANPTQVGSLRSFDCVLRQNAPDAFLVQNEAGTVGWASQKSFHQLLTPRIYVAMQTSNFRKDSQIFSLNFSSLIKENTIGWNVSLDTLGNRDISWQDPNNCHRTRVYKLADPNSTEGCCLQSCSLFTEQKHLSPTALWYDRHPKETNLCSAFKSCSTLHTCHNFKRILCSQGVRWTFPWPIWGNSIHENDLLIMKTRHIIFFLHTYIRYKGKSNLHIETRIHACTSQICSSFPLLKYWFWVGWIA